MSYERLYSNDVWFLVFYNENNENIVVLGKIIQVLICFYLCLSYFTII